ncbi:hypothetical protein DVH05_001434 [Phytophthora capsici]|nr:hypothetical protein DVH05_001434 [Phytophthora capsici]|eukprot:jgi/Phyca11/119619/e_gw1.39.350.1
MRLHCFLLAVATTLAVLNNGITTTEASSLRKVPASAPIDSINAVQPETRRLRSAETVYRHEDSYKRRPFIEEKLHKALTNPKKTKRLYARWYKSGFTKKQVAKGLDQSENRELDVTYENLAKGYAKYVDARRTQQQSV